MGTRRALPLACLCAVALGAGTARGQATVPDGDYLPDSPEWNGLADFFALARGLGLSPEARGEITWDELDDNTVLVVLYPRAALDEAAFVGWLQGGGRLLLGDDFGSAGPLLGRLGLTRHSGPAPAAKLYQDNPDLPIARPLGASELTAGVGAVITNHPAWLRGELDPVLGFGDRDLVCATGTVGTGTVVVLSDPSVFINNMLEFGGNLAFATNVLRTLARPGDRLLVVTGEFGSRGVPRAGVAELPGTGPAEAPAPPPAGPVTAFLLAFNRFLGGLGDAAPPELGLRALQVTGGAAALALLIALIGGSRRRADDSWAHPGGAPPRSSFEQNLRRYGDERSREGCGMMASLLRDEVEARLVRELDLDPVSALDPARAVPRLEARAGREAAHLLRRVLRPLVRVPSAQRPYAAVVPMPRPKLAALHRDVESLFALLDGRAPAHHAER
jgi:hypothetical protein